ncbi:MAG TPA: hypothetical protein VHZ51_00645 [Ktedonobacteraceae bacterium]|jgi:hypothetical protein|nr:hypothetical protein [Ktedonobacteraceae bacterium]
MLIRSAVKAGTIFYVGKGTGKRVASHESATRATMKSHKYMWLKHKHKVILEIQDAGYDVVQEIVGRTDDELRAYETESYYITQVGLQNLTNSTYGYRPKTKRSPRHR